MLQLREQLGFLRQEQQLRNQPLRVQQQQELQLLGELLELQGWWWQLARSP